MQRKDLVPALVLLMAVASHGMSPEDPMVLLQESTAAMESVAVHEGVGASTTAKPSAELLA